MPVLKTSADVIARTGIHALQTDTDLIPITDAPGFAERRLYPAGNELRQVVKTQARNYFGASFSSSLNRRPLPAA